MGEIKMSVSQCINIYAVTEDGIIPPMYDVFVVLHEVEDPVDKNKTDKVEEIVNEYFHSFDIKTMESKLNDLFPWGTQVIIQ